MAKLIQAIETTEKRGKGTEESPVRVVTQYWSPEGELLAEYDDWLQTAICETSRRLSRVTDDTDAAIVRQDERILKQLATEVWWGR